MCVKWHDLYYNFPGLVWERGNCALARLIPLDNPCKLSKLWNLWQPQLPPSRNSLNKSVRLAFLNRTVTSASSASVKEPCRELRVAVSSRPPQMHSRDYFSWTIDAPSRFEFQHSKHAIDWLETFLWQVKLVYNSIKFKWYWAGGLYCKWTASFLLGKTRRWRTHRWQVYTL